MAANSSDIDCVFSLVPCSYSITGNLILIAFYGVLLGIAAKLISDGAELLLDLGLPAAIIGGIVLPLLGAVPDSAMIIASGIGGSKEDAEKEISVGMGTLAGSTIMLLTVPWVAAMFLARVDIVKGKGVNGQCGRLKPSSFITQGVTVSHDVTIGALIMLITVLPYFVVQGADWHWGPTSHPDTSPAPAYTKWSALATFILCFIFFILYMAQQLIFSVASQRKDNARKEKRLERRVLRQFYLSMSAKVLQKTTNNLTQAQDDTDAQVTVEHQDKVQKKYFKAWRAGVGTKQENEPLIAAEAPTEKEESPDSSKGVGPAKKEEGNDEPKWKLALKSVALLVSGVAAVTIFSDPMVGALTSLVDPTHKNATDTSNDRGQYIPIPVFYLSFVITPLCSNASELVSSLIFAAKKTQTASSLTFSQLYGAATMNNTLCLGIFAALVYFRDLSWQFSAEVTVIILVEVAVGLMAVLSGFGYKHTYVLLLGIPVGLLYFLGLFLTAILENYAHWK
eukprot:Em0008g351a